MKLHFISLQVTIRQLLQHFANYWNGVLQHLTKDDLLDPKEAKNFKNLKFYHFGPVYRFPHEVIRARITQVILYIFIILANLDFHPRALPSVNIRATKK